MSNFDKERLSPPTGNSPKLEFSAPTSVQEMDALDHFESLPPEKRTRLLGEMYPQYAIWYNDQQKALAGAGGW